jgi:hypothetical protein
LYAALLYSHQVTPRSLATCAPLQLPYITHGSHTVADSEFIIAYLGRTYGGNVQATVLPDNAEQAGGSENVARLPICQPQPCNAAWRPSVIAPLGEHAPAANSQLPSSKCSFSVVCHPWLHGFPCNISCRSPAGIAVAVTRLVDEHLFLGEVYYRLVDPTGWRNMQVRSCSPPLALQVVLSLPF